MAYTIDSDKYIKLYLFMMFSMFIMSIVSVCLGYFGWFAPDDVIRAEWFQRSGSMVVGAMIVVELLQSKILHFYNKKNDDGERYINMSDVQFWLYEKSSIAAIFFALMGTFIWGYGDLFYTKGFF